MNKINWKVRLSNKHFWLSLIPAVILFTQIAASIFGFTIDLGDTGNKLLSLVNAAFSVLAIMGVVNDPTTSGLNDSAQALTYIKPKKGDGADG